MSKRKPPELRTERIVLEPTDHEAIRAETEASIAPEKDEPDYASLFVTVGTLLAGGVAISEALRKRSAGLPESDLDPPSPPAPSDPTDTQRCIVALLEALVGPTVVERVRRELRIPAQP